MQKLIYTLALFVTTCTLHAQDSSSLLLRKRGNEMLQIIAKEKDPSKRYELILNLLSTGTDSDPLFTLELAKKLYEIGEKENDEIAKASAWSYYGQGYRLTGNYIKALECHYKGIELAEKSGNSSVLGQAYNQIAHIYKDREEFEKAIELYQTARLHTQKGEIERAKIWPLMNLGAVYLGTGKTDSSLYYSREAYRMMSNLNFDVGYQYITYILGNIGGAYSILKLEKQAMDTFYLALAFVKTQNYPHLRQKQLLYTRIAEHFKQNGQTDSCLYYGKQAIAAVENTVFSYLNTRPARMVSEIYEQQHPDSAVKYLKLFLKTNEVINSTRVTQQLQMMSFEENQRALEIMQARKEYRSRLQIYFLLGGLLILLLFAGLMFRNNKQKQLANQLLQKQKNELETTLMKLSSTQQQLIQSEKMASLGELTAGIAHEIQNPLNFVNNFSEVSTELMDELNEELNKGDIQEAKAIGNDIKQNLEKINHHGKRADAIVKGMLQHSRTSSRQKELTDINTLCDEYLRLAYHGLKAKDLSFNTSFHFEPDNSLPKMNVVPQDIGRVLLNLINNAFQAFGNDEFRMMNAEIIPQVKISTKNFGNKIQISVKDNGPGIPDSIKDKIFHPFFTTKPTGQGTGLGLSLSYDIVKAHGGELKVETKEGEGSEFIIQIPVV